MRRAISTSWLMFLFAAAVLGLAEGLRGWLL